MSSRRWQCVGRALVVGGYFIQCFSKVAPELNVLAVIMAEYLASIFGTEKDK